MDIVWVESTFSIGAKREGEEMNFWEFGFYDFVGDQDQMVLEE